jgi:hypothetical protein
MALYLALIAGLTGVASTWTNLTSNAEVIALPALGENTCQHLSMCQTGSRHDASFPLVGI